MKFWKILSDLILQTLPDWRDKFLSYKHLKKHLKLINGVQSHADASRPIKRPKFTSDNPSNDVVSKEVNDFVHLLEVEIEKFNTFVVEKEEEYVIRWKELQDRLAEARHSNDELMGIGREIVDFHGEMVLLENYSALNYTGLVKILKKYDKRTGTLIRLPFIQKVLQEPFYTNDTIFKLIKECEATLEHIFSQNEQLVSSHVVNTEETSGSNPDIPKKERLVTADKELAEIEHMESMYMKLTLSALRALKEIRSGSSTVNAFSLPPMESTPQDETILKNILQVE
ncbi:SPX domain-containing protein 1-like [Silene latifolia]|uniref:SPX domain-containing protein 1-like n=1 Tax=Silene latifolia TaxID=37657 RepID=UPI003D7706C1